MQLSAFEKPRLSYGILRRTDAEIMAALPEVAKIGKRGTRLSTTYAERAARLDSGLSSPLDRAADGRRLLRRPAAAFRHCDHGVEELAACIGHRLPAR